MTQLAAATSQQPINAPITLGKNLAPIAVALFVAIALHGIGALTGAYSTRIMIDCGIAIIAAVSLTIVNGYTGQFSIGHAAFIALGSYASGMVTYYFLLRFLEPSNIREMQSSFSLLDTPFGWAESMKILALQLLSWQQWLLAFSCIVGGLVAAFFGWIVGLPSLRLKGDYLAIVTLGFGEIVRVLLQQTNPQIGSTEELKQASWQAVYWPPALNGALGMTDLPKVTNIFWTFLFVGLTVLIAYRVKTSSYGRALLSIREDEIAAEAMGVNTARLKVRAFVLAAFLAGIAGGLYAHTPGTNPQPSDAGFIRSFDIVMMVVLGGLGSISGSILAAILITLINAFSLKLAEYGLLEWRMPAFAMVLILMMIFRPKGLFGLNEVWDRQSRGLIIKIGLLAAALLVILGIRAIKHHLF